MEREEGLRRTRRTRRKETSERRRSRGKKIKGGKEERERRSRTDVSAPTRAAVRTHEESDVGEREVKEEPSSVYNIISRQTGPSLSRAFIPALYVASERIGADQGKRQGGTTVNGDPWIASDPFAGSFLRPA